MGLGLGKRTISDSWINYKHLANILVVLFFSSVVALTLFQSTSFEKQMKVTQISEKSDFMPKIYIQIQLIGKIVRAIFCLKRYCAKIQCQYNDIGVKIYSFAHSFFCYWKINRNFSLCEHTHTHTRVYIRVFSGLIEFVSGTQTISIPTIHNALLERQRERAKEFAYELNLWNLTKCVETF